MRRLRPAVALSVMGVVLLCPAMAAAQERNGQDRPALVDDRPVPEVLGVWRSQGYGYIARITREGIRLYHVAGSHCYSDTRTRDDTDDVFSFYRSLGADRIAFSGTPGQTRFVFDRLPALPPACSNGTPWSRPRIAALVAATFADLYPSFAERKIDWPARVAAAEPSFARISSDAALYDAIVSLLAGVEDPHVELHATVGGAERSFEPGDGITLPRVRSAGEQEWQRAYRRGILDTILQGKGHQTGNDRVLWGRVGDIGYVNFLGMGRFSANGSWGNIAPLDAVLDEALTAFAGARAVIVDISNNRGGGDRIAQHIAGRFTDSRRLAYTKIGFGAKDIEPQPFYAEPSPRVRYVGPVYLLTSDITLSAAEVFGLYMRALPNVIQVGDTTRGAFSDVIDKPLPNGWSLDISAEVYRDPEGHSYEARGLPPKLKREVFPANDLFGGHTRAVLALIDEIRRGGPAKD